MITLLELLFVLLAGGDPQALPHIPGAIRYEILTSRQVMAAEYSGDEYVPVFTGTVHVAAGEQLLGADCTFFPYWPGQTRYPCSPYTVEASASDDVTVWLDGDTDGEVVIVVRVLGYPHRVWLPEVAR